MAASESFPDELAYSGFRGVEAIDANGPALSRFCLVTTRQHLVLSPPR